VATSRTIFIAGAGIGGLTAALALAARGFRVVVLEKAEKLEEAGAGIQLSPNASRILIGLGLEDRLGSRAVAPEAISVMSARAGSEIARLPLGEAAGSRADAPYWVIHRADLQAALQSAVDDHPDIDLRLGCQFEDAAAHVKGLTVVHRHGNFRQSELGLALIGADGVWSTVRNHLFPETQPQFAGMIAWRGVIDATQLPREYTARRVQLWMGPGAHLVAYPVSGARRINIVAIVPGTWNRPGWSAPGDGQELRNVFSAEKWPGPARMMLGAVDNWRRWALFTLPEDGQWTRGAIALLGDAAHAMLPFAAQGAAMAIEDAAVIAKALSDGPMETTANVTAAFKRYARARRPRVAQMQRAARKAARTFHMSGPMAAARDFTIALLGARRMLARQHWIYDWRV
jgi:salicylate hydroxylase